MLSHLQSRNGTIVSLYTLVLLTMVCISKPEQDYSMFIRIGLFVVAMLPVLFSTQYILFSFASFYAINSTSFCRLLPSDEYYYVIVILFAFFLTPKSQEAIARMLKSYIAITPFLLLSLIWGDVQEFQLWWSVCLLFIPLLRTEGQFKLLAFSFPIVSFVLSLLYLLNQSYFMFAYSVDMERSNWINPNQFGGIIAVGIVMGIALLLKQFKIKISKFEFIFLFICVCTSFVVIVLNASRGSFLASSFFSLLLIFMSDMKKIYKLILVGCFCLFAFVLWQSGFFELLMFRMEADTASTAGNRSVIWAEKISSFFDDTSFLHCFIGFGGRAGAEAIGHSTGIANMSTHNDFVTAIVGYGIPCLFYFIYVLFYPFLNMPKGRSRAVFFVITMFVVVECSILEPMFRGYVTFVMLYIFLYTYSVHERQAVL